MNVPKTGLLVALAVAGGIAIGAASTTFAADPSRTPAAVGATCIHMNGTVNEPQMMGGSGMMSGSAQPLSMFSTAAPPTF